MTLDGCGSRLGHLVVVELCCDCLFQGFCLAVDQRAGEHVVDVLFESVGHGGLLSVVGSVSSPWRSVPAWCGRPSPFPTRVPAGRPAGGGLRTTAAPGLVAWKPDRRPS